MPFLPRSSISRFILFAVIPLALLAGIGLNNIKQKTIKILIIGFVAIDLFSLSYPLSEQAFIVPKNDVFITSAPPPIAFTANTYEIRMAGTDYPRSYLPTLAGYGTLNYCTPLSPAASVDIVADNKIPSYASVTDAGRGAASLISWSPNKVQVWADIRQNTDAVINTNYAKGWRVNGQPAKELSGRAGISLKPGTYRLTFKYRPPGLIAGLITTFITLALVLLLSFRQSKMD